ncbi:MAG: TlpA family protein disulfide reductase, partial [Candidatus Aminicenantes bacterium]|nr:TlpA family protein disulfide reductase [Candidatus Aminicenantes bacterium]
MIRFVRSLLITTLALAAAGAASACAQPQNGAETGPAPDFAIQDLAGNSLTLADYKGKVLVVNFWATWCQPCRVEIPDFIDAYRELKAEGLEILGLSVDRMTGPALLEWTRGIGVNYPVALATPQIIGAYEPGQYIPAT